MALLRCTSRRADRMSFSQLIALTIGILAAILDGLDGWLARKARMTERLRRPLRYGDGRAADSRAVGAGLAVRQGRRLGAAVWDCCVMDS